jgi:hypothetical protein
MLPSTDSAAAGAAFRPLGCRPTGRGGRPHISRSLSNWDRGTAGLTTAGAGVGGAGLFSNADRIGAVLTRTPIPREVIAAGFGAGAGRVGPAVGTWNASFHPCPSLPITGLRGAVAIELIFELHAGLAGVKGNWNRYTTGDQPPSDGISGDGAAADSMVLACQALYSPTGTHSP